MSVGWFLDFNIFNKKNNNNNNNFQITYTSYVTIDTSMVKIRPFHKVF